MGVDAFGAWAGALILILVAFGFDTACGFGLGAACGFGFGLGAACGLATLAFGTAAFGFFQGSS